MIVLAALTAMAIGFLGTAQTMAAPAQGSVIGAAAASTSPVTKVPCAMRRVCGRRGCAMRRVCW
jgi:hypothetical protein